MSSNQPSRLSLTSRILIGLGFGILCGLFFGEHTAWLSRVGDAFVRLLQMTVLPYIVVALVTSVGRLSPRDGARLLGRSVVVLVGLWIVGLVVFFLFPLALPTVETASFYSSSLIEPPSDVNFIGLFIPENVFDSLARYVVPAVVLFCLFLGAALMTMPDEQKSTLLGPLDVLREALGRVNSFVVKLTPYGVFAIAASLAGTMTVEEFGRIQGYLLIYTLSCLLLAFVIVPNVVAALTPFSARQVLSASREALIMAFATGKLLVVLPLLVEKTEELFQRVEVDSEQASSTVELLYPVTYPLPNLGKLASLIFLPFAAWFLGRSLLPGDYFALAGTGVVSSFAGPVVTVSFLLGVLRLPSDMMQLFIAPGVYTARVGDLLGTIHMIALVLIAGSWSLSVLRVRWAKVFKALAVSAGTLVVAIIGCNLWLTANTPAYHRDEVLRGMTRYVDPLVGPPAVELTDEEPGPLRAGQTRMQRILERRILRIGYRLEVYPFSFRNTAGDIVGFEIDLAERLAESLGVKLKLVETGTEEILEKIENDEIDLAMSGLPATPATAAQLLVSKPHMEAHLALVVRDHRAREFSRLEALQRDGITLAMPDEAYFRSRMEQVFPNLEVRVLQSPQEFFEAEEGEFDALLSSAEGGSAWTLLYPDFQVVRPEGLTTGVPIVHAMHPEATELARVVNSWIDLQESNGTIDALYNHWILGAGVEASESRWSVIKDVLGWVDR